MTLTKLVVSLVAAVAFLGGAGLFINYRASAKEAAAEAAYPPSGHFVSVGGTKVHYEIAGTGPDLVMIHGALGNLRDMTFALRDQLAPHYRVIVFDRPGFGYSDPLPNAEASLAAQARLLQSAARQIGVTNPVVLGQSFGGAVAISWGLHPDILPPAALVLVSAPTLPWPGTIDILYRVTGNAVGSALVVPLLTAFVTDAYLDRSLEGIFSPAAVPQGYDKFIGAGLSLRRSSLRANGKQVDILRRQLVAMQPRYAGLALPIELVHGDLDKTVPPDIHARPLSEILPDATLTIIPGAGHLPHHSHADAVIAAINRAAERAQLR
jgi:pimeloyl-ACP methyl ester carboxylesterase